MKLTNPAWLVTAAMSPRWLNAIRRGSPPTSIVRPSLRVCKEKIWTKPAEGIVT